MTDIVIFTDGASSGNPGPGGWGAVIGFIGRGEVVELGGGEPHTTNNRMELMAVIQALAHIRDIAGTAALYTDSKYVRDGAMRWLPVWEKRGWKTTAKKEVLNQDLWLALSELMQERAKKGAGSRIIWQLVRGHVGLAANERADVIAVAFSSGAKRVLYVGSQAGYTIALAPFADTDHYLKTAQGDGANDSSRKSSRKSKSRSAAAAYSYISMVKGEIQVHKTWDECKKRVNGVSGTRFKKALSAEDEKKIIAEFKSL